MLVGLSLGCGSSAQPPGGSAGTGGTLGAGGAGGAPADASAPDATAENTDTSSPMPDVTAPLTADAGATGDAAASFGRQACVRGCNTASALRCPMAATCVSKCQADLDELTAMKPECRPFFEGLLACAALRPVTDWQCGADGKEHLRDGVCDMEGQRAAQCLLGS